MMIQWIEIKSPSELPKTEQSFLAIWKGRICIAQYEQEDDAYFVSFDPAIYEKNWEIPKDREYKFTHICMIKYPESYPEGW